MGLSNVIVIAYFASWLQRNSEHVSLAPRLFRISLSIVKPVFGVGIGELLNAGFLIVTALALNNLATAYGDSALAAIGVAVRIAQVPEFLVMGITLGVLPLLAYAYGKDDRARLSSALRAAAIAVGGVTALFAALGIAFPEPIIAAFSSDRSVLAIGVVALVAQLVAMIANGFTGLLTSSFQACGRALPAIIMSMAQGVLFIPVVILGNLWFGLPGIVWALTVTEVTVLLVGLVLWAVARRKV
ncbi:MATE family efflux transporter [Galbitalea soli]|uniref:MATE family efflux transporter n=1 Tax=Galbitalea soli TaxID=1268042 RepID=UPI00183C7E00|nr:MATE family efflux transporter [Galbitalea soli]NYJ32089.1 Na+-driven multidrug efflux pump [Galbitalea soli]